MCCTPALGLRAGICTTTQESMYPMLTEVRYRNAICPPDRKQARFTDVAGCTCKSAPSGSKRWFYKYRSDGKEGSLL